MKITDYEDPANASDDRRFALFCAIINHGLANLAESAIPAGPEKIVETALRFERHLLTKE